MDCVRVLERIRTLIRRTFGEYGADPNGSLSEAMLIRDGFFCGRRFQSDGLQAVWFIEENELKFYRRDGSILRVIALTPDLLEQESERSDQRRAA